MPGHRSVVVRRRPARLSFSPTPIARSRAKWRDALIVLAWSAALALVVAIVVNDTIRGVAR